MTYSRTKKPNLKWYLASRCSNMYARRSKSSWTWRLKTSRRNSRTETCSRKTAKRVISTLHRCQLHRITWFNRAWRTPLSQWLRPKKAQEELTETIRNTSEAHPRSTRSWFKSWSQMSVATSDWSMRWRSTWTTSRTRSSSFNLNLAVGTQRRQD